MELFISEHWLDILSTILGIIYIVLEYRASIILWIVGIIMPAIDIFLFYSHGLYADFGMAIYYTLAAVYGYLFWLFGGKAKQGGGSDLHITHFKKKFILPSVLLMLCAWAAIYWILIEFTNSDVPITDSFVNALSFIGLWALAHKYLEQWLIWILVDVVCSILYAAKGLPFKASLYGLYVLIAILGYRSWKKKMDNENHFA